MTEQEIDQKCLDQASQLETEFFDIVNEGLPNQHRVLKDGKIQEEFSLRHEQIWKDHWDELVANGYEEPIPELSPSPDEARLAEIISNPVEALTMPEVWEAIRILARLRGIESI